MAINVIFNMAAAAKESKAKEREGKENLTKSLYFTYL